MIWHSSSPSEVLSELNVDDKKGLSNGEVDERLDIYGQNVISKIEKTSILSRFFAQLKNKTVILRRIFCVCLLFFLLLWVFRWFSILYK